MIDIISYFITKRVIMDKLLEGVIEFKEKFFKKHKDIYKHLAHSQKPHTLYWM